MGRLSHFLLPLVIAIAAPVVAMAQSVEAVRPDDRTLGSLTAPVTLTVYLSATCSHCAAWHTNDFPAIRARFVDTGKVRVVFRDLPTAPQEQAIVGAVMARCVPEDRYDAALDALFRGQKAVRDASGSREAVAGWLVAAGQAGGLSLEQMNACVSDPAAFAAVETRASQSMADGIDSTPSFLVNGQKIPDYLLPGRDVEAFDELFEPFLGDGW